MKLTKEQEEMLKEKFNKMQLDSFDLGAEFVIRMMREDISETMEGFTRGVSHGAILDHLNYIEKVIKKRKDLK